jgi:hypothetical protein
MSFQRITLLLILFLNTQVLGMQVPEYSKATALEILKLPPTLDLTKEENQKSIRKKYYELSLEYHPDRWSNAPEEQKKAAEEKFKELGRAKKALEIYTEWATKSTEPSTKDLDALEHDIIRVIQNCLRMDSVDIGDYLKNYFKQSFQENRDLWQKETTRLVETLVAIGEATWDDPVQDFLLTHESLLQIDKARQYPC